MFGKKSVSQEMHTCEKCGSEIQTTQVIFDDDKKKEYKQLIIFTITTIEKIEKDINAFANVAFGDKRTVGFYNSFKDAENAVVNNVCDICECLYRYALIEQTEEGMYPDTLTRWLYKYNKITEEYELLPKDAEEYKLIEHTCNFGLG